VKTHQYHHAQPLAIYKYEKEGPFKPLSGRGRIETHNVKTRCGKVQHLD
jgi:uncharacterized protein YqhQ